MVVAPWLPASFLFHDGCVMKTDLRVLPAGFIVLAFDLAAGPVWVTAAAASHFMFNEDFYKFHVASLLRDRRGPR